MEGGKTDSFSTTSFYPSLLIRNATHETAEKETFSHSFDYSNGVCITTRLQCIFLGFYNENTISATVPYAVPWVQHMGND